MTSRGCEFKNVELLVLATVLVGSLKTQRVDVENVRVDNTDAAVAAAQGT